MPGASVPSTTTGRIPVPFLPVDSATSCSTQSPNPAYAAPPDARTSLSTPARAACPRSAPRRSAGDYEIPAGFDAAAHFDPAPEAGTRRQAVIAIAPGRAEPLRREGTLTGTTARGWDTFSLEYEDEELCATTLAEFGPSVRVMSPRELAAAHRVHVQATISALTGLVSGEAGAGSAAGAGEEDDNGADDT